MKIRYSISIGLFVGMLTVISSCTSDFEDINTSETDPTEVPSTNLLGYALEDFTNKTFNTTIDGGESGYANQIGKIQYMEEAIYEFRDGDFNSYWQTVYRDLENLKEVEKQADAEGATNMKAAAITFSAFIWQIATDMWRDIPFSDALAAADGNYSPSYDTQETIYPAVMDSLAKANELFNEGASDKLGDGDFLFNGDLTLWQKFANSLRLRMAMRLSNVDPTTSKSIVEQILADPTTYPVMTSNDDNAYYYWDGTDPYEEPWYYNKVVSGRDDHGIADVLVDTLKYFSDPRLQFYAHPAPSDNVYRGVTVGTTLSSFSMNDISRIGTRFRDVADGSSPLMSYSELLFIVAEGAQRGWNVGMTANEAYDAAITASMKENTTDKEGEIADSQIAAYLAQSDVAFNNTLTCIYLQKWIALFKNGPEAWAENRRTDVPQLSPSPDGDYSANHNRPPFHQPYPNNEYDLNYDNIQPYWAQVSDYLWGKQMYWDTRVNVY